MILSLCQVTWRFCCGVWRSRRWTCCWRSFLENLYCTTNLGPKEAQRISYCTVRKINWAAGEEQSSCKLQPSANISNGLLNVVIVFLLKYHHYCLCIKNWLPLWVTATFKFRYAHLPVFFFAMFKSENYSKMVVYEPNFKVILRGCDF